MQVFHRRGLVDWKWASQRPLYQHLSSDEVPMNFERYVIEIYLTRETAPFAFVVLSKLLC